ncbi:FAD-dependent oxidoreductase [Sphaerotilus mobilis]|uniref:D-amino-acid dehydrogenase n=1 Tax=Sphaerotilus mobilis TaxID=47994 RepID=A0A4Q7LVC5_9BURK|nr:FAD-dependent oxidoreductase [Sphaerotilus mobilis]RZS58641.1 D-amino-acid dehydrogenase [Sphaerotilus mobilis]
MRIAVIGAGVAGMASACELSEQGHDVTVYDRHDGVAEASSFAHANLLTPGLVSPAAAPGLRRWLWRGLRHHSAALRWHPLQSPATYRWLWRWWRASRRGHGDDVRAMTELALLSMRRLDSISRNFSIAHERSAGVLVLLRHASELAPTHRHAQMLRELGWSARELSPEECREVEPHLGHSTLAGGLQLPLDAVSNCRLWVQRLRDALVRERGVQLRLGTEVRAIRPAHTGQGVDLTLAARPGSRVGPGGAEQGMHHDAVVLCAGADTGLLQGVGVRIPLMPVWGQSLTLRLRPDSLALQSGVIDARAGVTLTRLGERLRVTGGYTLGPRGARASEDALRPLYGALDRWFGHATERASPLIWQGARPMLPDGPPIIGPAPMPGVWLNVGHGAHGWTLACGSAKLLAEQISGQNPSVDPVPFALSRWQA